MKKITVEDLNMIIRRVEKDFPDDPALQQIHISRKIIAKEAEYQGLTYTQYIKTMGLSQQKQ